MLHLSPPMNYFQYAVVQVLLQQLLSIHVCYGSEDSIFDYIRGKSGSIDRLNEAENNQ